MIIWPGLSRQGKLPALHHQAYSMPSLVSPPACGCRLFTAPCRRRRGTHRVSCTKECRLARRVDLLLLQSLICKFGLLVGAIQLQLLRKKYRKATVARASSQVQQADQRLCWFCLLLRLLIDNAAHG